MTTNPIRAKGALTVIALGVNLGAPMQAHCRQFSVDA